MFEHDTFEYFRTECGAHGECCEIKFTVKFRATEFFKSKSARLTDDVIDVDVMRSTIPNSHEN